MSLALSIGLIGGTAWSPASHACAVQPYLGAVCIMATPKGFGGFGHTYAPAIGQILAVADFQALFSLIGTTWGGDGSTVFFLPDLSGRVVVGSGTTPSETIYLAGQAGGTETVTLSSAQLPVHNHALEGAAVDISRMTATTTLSGLSATITGSPILKAASGGTSGNDPAGKSLATTSGAATRIYSDAPPSVAMNAAAIDASGLAIGNFTGTATTKLGGTAGVSGATSSAGSSAPVSVMQPYLVMNYYIAMTGIFPSRD